MESGHNRDRHTQLQNPFLGLTLTARGGHPPRGKDSVLKELEYKRAHDLLVQARVYFPAIVPRIVDDAAWLIYSATYVIGTGDTIGAAYADVVQRGNLPVEPHFIPFRSEGTEVRQGVDIIAYVSSRTMAARIANALNQYVPNVRKS